MVNLNWDFLQQFPNGACLNNISNKVANYEGIMQNAYYPSSGYNHNSLNNLFGSIDKSIAADPYNLGFTAPQNNIASQLAFNPQNNAFDPFQGLMQMMMMFMQTFMQFMNMANQQQNPGQNILPGMQNNPLFNGGAIAITGTDANGNIFAGAATFNNNTGLNNQNPLVNQTNPYNNTPVLQGTKGNQVAQIALHESTLGINEADGSYRKYGQPSHWCGAFAEWCVKQATGGKVPWKGENFHYVPNITSWAKKNNVYESYNPSTVQQRVKPGDMIIFQGGRRSESSHVGIVTAIRPDGTIETVEGNTSDQCKKRVYKPGDPKIQGFLLVNQLEAMGLI
ncbi:MAG: CHAP domain-containing protein [Cyanobacteriota bacterium]